MEYKLSDGYAATRDITAIFCGLSMAWSALQFEINSIQTETFGEVDLSGASIPLLFITIIAYNSFRTTVEFMMQSVEIRRWRYAQLDFKSIFWLTQASLTLLAASAIHRSFETLGYVALAWIAIPISVIILTVLMYVVTFPMTLFIGSLKKRTSVASMAMEGFAWATLLVILIVIVGIIGGSLAVAKYEPIRSLWLTPPSPLNIGLFATTAVAVTFMMFSRENLFINAFSMSSITVHERNHKGKPIRMTIGNPPPVTTDWYQVKREDSIQTSANPEDA
ncbi:hypothetical protein [Pseudomonas sp. 18175]|uniref:hypothetical protein n=1 Tax=Pseudomonas sp. 18175 TaxID=3390056 RepID=UPI003D2399BC